MRLRAPSRKGFVITTMTGSGDARTRSAVTVGRVAGTGVATKAVAGVGLASVAAYLVVVLQRIGYPYELTYFEGSTVEVTGRVAAGLPLYGPPTTAYTPWPYPPLYFWVTGALAEVTGVTLRRCGWCRSSRASRSSSCSCWSCGEPGGAPSPVSWPAGLYAATFRVSGAFADTARVDSLLLALLLVPCSSVCGSVPGAAGWPWGCCSCWPSSPSRTRWWSPRRSCCGCCCVGRAAGATATVTLGVGVLGSTLVGNLLTDGWYARYVIEQLPSQSWTLRWLTAFWVEDLLVPFAVSALVVVAAGVVVLVRRRRAASERRPWWGRSEDDGYLAAAAVGLLAASWVARLHEGGFANVAMPAQAAVAGALGLLLARWLRAGRPHPAALAAVAVLLAVQVVVLTLSHVDVVPTTADREAGDRFIATLERLPGTVLVPTHPYYLRLAGRPTHASAIAIYDLSHAKNGPELLAGVLPWDLDGVSAVVLDNSTDTQLFGDQLGRDFTLVTSTVVPDDVFRPVTDLPTHPALLYVRTSLLPLG